ncbi:acyl-CoA dehydrogenase family protein [Kineobactrum salinum]|uniref:Acyl-CoA dehydrogenase n=1 Tax=Kineobactrum salinum TaxID=2708301 RepID=A0A6C0U8H1_9GAMM|nr:acyl-CoA dehydrogenase family protein [Kineobactrum salinum]QIB66815.1 acyl-CoA dehydrogenase [Kineobactrum salinum]
MDFRDNAQEAEFRKNTRDWLAVHGSIFTELKLAKYDREKELEIAKRWQAAKAEAGYACIAWPVEWGGRGGTAMEQTIFSEEEEKLGVRFQYFSIGLGMCLPTVIAFSDKETKSRLVPPAVRGDTIWCQLFSEPAAGSDVAGIRTRAIETEDGSWLLSGQKVWTSYAHQSDYGIVLARTNPDVPKHKGLTMFWLDMKSPGIEVRPIHMASGESDFNEVFFTDVRVKDSQRLGEVNQGWKTALLTLDNERLSFGGAEGPDWEELMSLAATLPSGMGGGSVLKEGGFRDKLADFYVLSEGLKYTRLRSLTTLSRGQTPGPENSVGKLISATQMQRVANEALERLDQYGILADEDFLSDVGAFQRNFYWGAAMRIAGGTDEILRNIIAERVLGLPREHRLDAEVAFKDLPKGI